MADLTKKLIAKTFLDLADTLETGSYKKAPRILVSGLGSEYGEENIMAGAAAAAAQGAEIIYIGNAKDEKIRTIAASSEGDAHDIMGRLLKNGEADGAVTMHYSFPIGVSTVGRVMTPARGKPMYIATTTGTSSSNRLEGLIKNAINGIITAKACGLKEPTIGILNIEGARQAETALKELQSRGYKINFASSGRADGGSIMRGNDILTGACDVLVSDPLTGNILVKVLSSFTTGGGYEATGWGYGPGIGFGYDNLIMIVSRASGAPVIANAIAFASELVRGNYREIAAAEFASAEKAGLKNILENIRQKQPSATQPAPCKAPPKEIVTADIAGLEITDLDDAVGALWQAGIYAESGMGCTGPIILVNEARLDEALKVLAAGGWVSAS